MGRRAFTLRGGGLELLLPVRLRSRLLVRERSRDGLRLKLLRLPWRRLRDLERSAGVGERERECEAERGDMVRRGESAAADSRRGGVRESLRPRECGERESMAGQLR
jgi:hypothetical protein